MVLLVSGASVRRGDGTSIISSISTILCLERICSLEAVVVSVSVPISDGFRRFHRPRLLAGRRRETFGAS